jgi:flavin reductase (DIM6/NTAB) family NADH-FMN oxidoreductase RutF
MDDDANRDGIGAALGRIPAGLFILTAEHEERRTGILSSWVQQVAFEPPMVSVAIAKGRNIMPLISGSHRFGLCQLPDDDKVLLRKFAGRIESGEDPFLGFDLVSDTQTPLPILANVLGYLECEVKSHMDVDGDHDLFVGRIVAGRYIGGKPFIHVRDNGFKY